mmetsp:Transcript_16270/g.39670  ORF Transcript_16270/g.39670 Transcript_16270/m.39670 type:complete len:117 (+) Transcript_16270:1-351(+)
MPTSPAELPQHICVRLQPGDAGRTWRLSGGEQTLNVDVDGRFVGGSVSMVRELILRGAGIGALDVLIARNDLATGALVPVLPDWDMAPAPVHLLTVSRFTPGRVRLFGDLLAHALG